MDWNLAKNLAIIFLLVLNVFLLGLIFANRETYLLTANQEKAIYRLLSQSKVSLYDEIIREYQPKKQLVMSPYHYDTDTLCNAFFTNSDDIKIMLEYDKTIYKGDMESLIVQKDNVVYETKLSQEDISKLNKETVLAMSNQAANRIKKLFPGLIFDLLYETDGEWVVEYRQEYQSNKIQTNDFVFRVNRTGEVWIQCQYSKPVSFKKNSRDIVSPDVALFIFVQHINNLYGDMDVFINKMDIVYVQIDLLAEPYYRFYIADVDIPVLIHAYTGAVSNLGLSSN